MQADIFALITIMFSFFSILLAFYAINNSKKGKEEIIEAIKTDYSEDLIKKMEFKKNEKMKKDKEKKQKELNEEIKKILKK